jgi:uncharacterized membrane protein YkoI
MKGKIIAVTVGVLGLVATAAAGEPASTGKETRIAMKDAPSAVRVAAEKAIADGSLKHVVMEKEDGQVAYSVEATVAGKAKEFTFAADGTLLAEEDEDVAFAQLPEAVRAAAEKYFGGSRDLRASSEVAKGVTTYEVQGRKGGMSATVKLSAEGAVLDEEDED